MWRLFYSIKAALRFHDYNPQPVTFLSTHRWMGQVERRDRRVLGKLLDNVIYFSQDRTRRILLGLNDQLLQRLANAGIPAKKVVYVSFDDTASSSHMMLGMLRDGAALQQRGCNLCDSRDIRGLMELADKLKDGAIVYVDDFVGSARQLGRARDFVMQYVFGNFAEFLLVPSICEEGKDELERRGIEILAHNVHMKTDRALQTTCTFMNEAERNRVIEICEEIDPKMALGIEKMATMVVFYRNSPNQIPAVLRGNKDLKPFRGIFPRTTDLPFKRIVQGNNRKLG
jgi:hypothetical protein